MTADARENRPSEVPAAFARREFVLGACASAAALSFAATLGLPIGTASAFAFEPPAGGGLNAFVALSQQLTGRASLNATLGKRIYEAFAQSDSGFPQSVAALNTWLKSHGGVPSDTVTAALAVENPRLAKTVGDVMRAWYLGLIGETPMTKVVAYESALMFDPVKDVLTIPSYCRDVPFYWSKKPGGG
ncbi:D-sorbitol dehydrogenase-like protein [Trinickia symbiotica]|uniref:Sorbitol dehydrogenase n=1 Tax=Trinickia symbiotica TaxID=863227 RepID=A0A2N7X666_9BURK|nr:sugar dehydrogenase complex small subunit [Trinickia symbiotica]PMS37256.1 sorbitol dehydrogenase [Trinickia symbiotica]PPK42669.1 D-sorbitol dehydrogenase-like protein [Trinickia symbiotica]